jgi:tRNA pseudouridine38-40 synthase
VGTRYNGWQSQSRDGAKTVQQTIESVLSTLLRASIELCGCGRTDTGVHAYGYIAHMDVAVDIDPHQLVYKANKMLPPDIAIHHLEAVKENAHARYDAYSRTYHYHIHLKKDVFAVQSFHYTYGELNIEVLNTAASILKEYLDFTPFCKTNSGDASMICHVTHAQWYQEGDRLRFEITANRFLRGMIRLIVGMCINVNRGRLTIDQVRIALEHSQRLPEDWSVPADGLILRDICYPEEIRLV